MIFSIRENICFSYFHYLSYPETSILHRNAYKKIVCLFSIVSVRTKQKRTTIVAFVTFGVLLLFVAKPMLLQTRRVNVYLQSFVKDVNPHLQNIRNRNLPVHQRKPYAEFWKEVENYAENDTLYPETANVDKVQQALRSAKIIHADIFLRATSLKWILTLEGGQQVIFKPQTVPRSRRFRHCFSFDCEHPEYEIAAFTINRLLGLRNMPFTTGRHISWWEEIVPVATSALIQGYRNASYDSRTVCSEIWCSQEIKRHRFCFQDGIVSGAMIYFIRSDFNVFTDNKSEFYKYKIGLLRGEPHHDLARELDRPPGYDTYCKIFPNHSIYRQDRYFAAVTDISVMDYLMSHSDSRHTYINTSNGEVRHVMNDFGRAFCTYPEQLRILAPVIQCCKVRKKVYENLMKYRGSLVQTFEVLSRDDLLYPLLEPDLREILEKRHIQLLLLVDFCFVLKNKTDVLMDN